MKKIVLLILLFAGMANAQVLTFADISFKAMLVNGGDANFTAFSNGNRIYRIDTNFDNQIQASEAALIDRLWIEGDNAYAVTNIQGIEGFSNLSELGFIGISTPTISLSGMPNLKKLSCKSPMLTAAAISGMPGLESVSFSENPLLASLSISNCANLDWILAQNNDALSTFNVSNLANVKNIWIPNNKISSLDLTGCPSLQSFSANNNLLATLNVSGLASLGSFVIEENTPLTAINASGCTSLNLHPSNFQSKENLASIDFSNCSSQQMLLINNTALETLNLSGCTALTQANLRDNNLASLNLAGCTALRYLECGNNQLASLNVSPCPNIENLLAYNNQISSLNLTGCTNLVDANLGSNRIPSLDLSGNTRLATLNLSDNPTAALNVSGCTALASPYLNNTQLVNANFSGCSSIENIYINSNLLSSINVAGCDALINLNLIVLDSSRSPLATLDVSGHSRLKQLICTSNNLSSVNLEGCTALEDVSFYLSAVESIDLSDAPNIKTLNIGYSNIASIDLSNLHQLQSFSASGNVRLKSVFAKNGASELLFFNNQNAALEFICQDEEAVEDTELRVHSIAGLSNVVVNSYCSFTPGGNYNTITGTIAFDLNANGCDASDARQSNLRIDLNDGSQESATFTNADGNYTFYTGAGNFSLMPRLENPSLFSISPAAATIPFPDENNAAAVQNFCIAAVGNRADTEIVIAPIWPAKPGFTAWYQIVIKNKGNQTASGTFNLAYDQSILHYAIATQAPQSQIPGNITWSYASLLPFENRSVYIALNVNSPTQVPPANLGDQLAFMATINPIVGDFNTADNQFIFNQEVVGSFDPNDITCLQGERVSPDAIGDYLHYVVNFENTGTAAAENVVVKVVIDETQYDIDSLQLLNTSHQSRSIVRGNVAEFIFEDIQLGAAGDPPVNGHGTILFKIKSLGTLSIGDHVEKTASIFFDYNAPIDTNLAATIFQSLGNPDHSIDQSIVMYPNPAKNLVAVECSSTIKSIELFDIQGRALQTLLLDAPSAKVDISGRANGLYFMRITSETGVKVEKLVKE